LILIKKTSQIIYIILYVIVLGFLVKAIFKNPFSFSTSFHYIFLIGFLIIGIYQYKLRKIVWSIIFISASILVFTSLTSII